MKVVMNYKGWRVGELGERWSCEARGQIVLCTLDEYAKSLREAIQEAVDGMRRGSGHRD